MALIYATTLSPTKPEMIAEWLPRQPWFTGNATRIDPIAAYRFDDPDGDVGMESHLVTAGDDTVYQVPLTYRGAELTGGEAFLLGTIEHGVLGKRWIYDAIGDPVYRTALATAIAQGGTEAEHFVVDSPGAEAVKTETTTHVKGSGSPDAPVPVLSAVTIHQEGPVTIAETDLATLTVVRVLHTGPVEPPRAGLLRGTWPGQESHVLLAALTA
ncbi:MAG: CG0192-related protein [Leucobacter sp.]